MGTETIHATGTVRAKPKAVYEAYLDAATHAAMTGADATSEPLVGGSFTAWDGYISGRHLELHPVRRIVQSWRTSEFPAEAGDSRLIVLFDEDPAGTRVTFVHTDIPAGQGSQYETGWHTYYLAPMQRYFGPAKRATPPKKKAAAKKAARPARAKAKARAAKKR